MRLLGASAPSARPVLDEAGSAAFEGRAFVVVSDGYDLSGVFADEGDSEAEFQRWAAKLLPVIQ